MAGFSADFDQAAATSCVFGAGRVDDRVTVSAVAIACGDSRRHRPVRAVTLNAVVISQHYRICAARAKSDNAVVVLAAHIMD